MSNVNNNYFKRKLLVSLEILFLFFTLIFLLTCFIDLENMLLLEKRKEFFVHHSLERLFWLFWKHYKYKKNQRRCITEKWVLKIVWKAENVYKGFYKNTFIQSLYHYILPFLSQYLLLLRHLYIWSQYLLLLMRFHI